MTVNYELPYMVTKVPDWSDLFPVWWHHVIGTTLYGHKSSQLVRPIYMVTKVPEWSDLFPVWRPHVIGTTLYGHKSSPMVRPISGLTASCHWNYLIWSQKFPVCQTYFRFDGLMSLKLTYMVTKVPGMSDLFPVWRPRVIETTLYGHKSSQLVRPIYMVTKVPEWSDLFPVWRPHVIGTTLYGHKSSRMVRPISSLTASCHWNYLIWSQKFPIGQTYFQFDGLMSLEPPYRSLKFPLCQTYFRFDGLMSLKLPYMVTKVPVRPIWKKKRSLIG